LFNIIIGIFGGLALFLFGMKSMGDGLQKVAGDRLRKILERATRYPVIAVLLGALVTATIQSSSATAVLVVSFVNAGLMTLKQAIGVIMGANIGTTITAQIIAFKLTDYIFLKLSYGLLPFLQYLIDFRDQCFRQFIFRHLFNQFSLLK
jgi:phosphate:Na+ symporter